MVWFYLWLIFFFFLLFCYKLNLIWYMYFWMSFDVVIICFSERLPIFELRPIWWEGHSWISNPIQEDSQRETSGRRANLDENFRGKKFLPFSLMFFIYKVYVLRPQLKGCLWKSKTKSFTWKLLPVMCNPFLKIRQVSSPVNLKTLLTVVFIS